MSTEGYKSSKREQPQERRRLSRALTSIFPIPLTLFITKNNVRMNPNDGISDGQFKEIEFDGYIVSARDRAKRGPDGKLLITSTADATVITPGGAMGTLSLPFVPSTKFDDGTIIGIEQE